MGKKNNTEFKDRIKEIRINRGFTTAQVARLLNKNESTIRIWEFGKSVPDADTLVKIADCFRVSVDYLLGRNTINSYFSAFSALIELDRFSTMYIYNDTIGFETDNDYLDKFINEWGMMKTHLRDGLINDDVYKLWMESQLIKAINFDEQETILRETILRETISSTANEIEKAPSIPEQAIPEQAIS